MGYLVGIKVKPIHSPNTRRLPTLGTQMWLVIMFFTRSFVFLDSFPRLIPH